MNKTYIPKKENKCKAKWYIIDAKNQNLGRLSTKVALILQGKNEIIYTPYINPMQYIIVTNAKYITVTGQKKHKKLYKRHSGKPGGLKITNFNNLNQKSPHKIIEKSIKGMLPKTTLGRQLFRQLKVYSDTHHPHTAQQPEILP